RPRCALRAALNWLPTVLLFTGAYLIAGRDRDRHAVILAISAVALPILASAYSVFRTEAGLVDLAGGTRLVHH
ncbi:MAG: hypothetical protein KDB53_13995, partial [Planctomycetes bacterium]|nr:hypothetical protein [Planctomycetota bacterium]